MKDNKIILLIAFTLLSVLNAVADVNLPASVEVYTPKILLEKLISEEDIEMMISRGDWGQSTKPSQLKHWVVFSDRDMNITYSSPSSSASSYSQLSFNEKVIIATIKNGYALVYTDPKNEGWPAYSHKAESKGWIPMSNLLLWQSCPVDSKGIYRKALLALNIDKATKKSEHFCYSNPQLKSDPKRMKTDMTFYYVMKTDVESGLILLANHSSLSGNTSQVLYGWVNENSFVPWNQRSCLEPNWKPKDVAYFNSPNGKRYNIYGDMNLDTIGASYIYGVKNKDDNSAATKYRMNAYQTRLPILDLPENVENLYRCTTFGTAGRAVINPEQDQYSLAKEKLVSTLEKMKHINIIFVIDGTQSMKPYFKSVETALEQGVKFFQDPFIPRFGVVIYRDYNDGEYLTESVPLSKPTDPKLKSFLKTAGVYGATSSNADRTLTEALYKGLEVASDPVKMGFTKDESTIVVVVGDCGNAVDDTNCLPMETIVDRFVANNIQVLSCQVLRREQQAWILFNDQMSKIINQNLTRQYKNIYADAKPRFKAIPSGYDFLSGQDKNSIDFFVGSIRFAEQVDKALDPAKLTSLIEDNIGKFSLAIQGQIDALIKGSEGLEGGDQDYYTDANASFLVNKIGKEAYEALKQSGASFAFSGYAPKKDPQGRDYWKPVAFVSREELGKLLERLAIVYNNARIAGDRKPYVDAVMSLIRIMVPDISEAEMKEMGIAEVMRLAQGLNEASNAVKGRTLTEIQDIKIVNAAEYQTLVNVFCEKYERLLKVYDNENYKYKFKTPNDQTFYWIPVEDLP